MGRRMRKSYTSLSLANAVLAIAKQCPDLGLHEDCSREGHAKIKLLLSDYPNEGYSQKNLRNPNILAEEVVFEPTDSLHRR